MPVRSAARCAHPRGGSGPPSGPGSGIRRGSGVLDALGHHLEPLCAPWRLVLHGGASSPEGPLGRPGHVGFLRVVGATGLGQPRDVGARRPVGVWPARAFPLRAAYPPPRGRNPSARCSSSRRAAWRAMASSASSAPASLGWSRAGGERRLPSPSTRRQAFRPLVQPSARWISSVRASAGAAPPAGRGGCPGDAPRRGLRPSDSPARDSSTLGTARRPSARSAQASRWARAPRGGRQAQAPSAPRRRCS